ncbi:hypothetical protein A374_06731 [Fictibacillus macauensis ZFHKF-1]|uniref:Spo0E like sporulation regulatory protein n=1 Tax=Fictibacillus macauensis ZFHKF-1 TaxID=1196324 RepID=I8AKZ7_9BACL|nr:aspartyl-phosphate phosphatase Spo0E family protein [Fictibacillus macauensis]EIT86274.1 hypothetical protein A374_06731 [Fictibacillus macauensis ZFHKF-1]
MLAYEIVLRELIEVKREELITTGMTKGLNSDEVLTISQELDLLLNMYQLITALFVSF